MYSLYRAWLSLNPPPAAVASFGSLGSPGYIPQYSNGAPDINLHVGPTMTHFSAHKNILAAHSGYFKAILMNQTDSNTISVPNINVDEFSSLLTFMYTGFLDLNFSNIYNILLATHLLHMPRALEICRSFLIQNHPLESSTTTNIIKPIASRKYLLEQQPPILPPLYGKLEKSDVTPFRAPQKLNHTKTSKDFESPQPQIEKVKKRRSSEKVVIDVACCDGPIRFQRVLNKNYGNKDVENDIQQPEIDRNVLMNKVMSDNIREKQSENESGSGDIFTCVYCNHTFKSQYCYQKHARRHLNPVNLEVTSIQKIENYVNNKREVKLLDMNVQYYPCKTCGSKFPSYYFVHKHRKLCHGEETESGDKSQDLSDKNEESEIEVAND